MNNQRGFIGGFIAVVLVLALVLGPVLLFRALKYESIKTHTFTVTELPERIAIREGDTYANLVYTDNGVYSNVDSTFPWKKNSSDIRAQLKEGETYTCEVSGWRIGWLSWYRNITRCDGFEKFD
jgi:hypothetical protein